MNRKKIKNEAALVLAARDGDKQSLQALLENNWSWLKGLVYNVLGNVSDMDDALQNICVLVIKNIAALREPERFRPWLATLAKRAALTWRQKMAKRPRPLDEVTAAGLRDPGRPDMTEQLDRKEQYHQILDAVDRLPDKYREVFVMKYMNDLSYADMAEILDVPVTTIQIRLVRARRMIYNRLTGRPNDKVPRT